MLLPDLRKAVLEANLELVRKGLALYTFGNTSGISRKESLVVIKPSGVPYDRMKSVDLVVTDLDGKVVKASCGLPRICPRTSFFTSHFLPSEASVIRIRSMQQPGHRRAAPSRVSAPRTRITSTAPFPSRKKWQMRRSPQIMKKTPVTPLCARLVTWIIRRSLQCW